MELTNDELLKVAAMYIGAPVSFLNPVTKEWSKYRKITPTGLQLIVNGNMKWDLLLCPLSAITDEHAIKAVELAKDMKYNKNETFQVIKEDSRVDVYSSKVIHASGIDMGYRYKSCIYSDCYFRPDDGKSAKQMNYEAYQYLISVGYAVPLWFGIDHWANGKTAIELGIASKETTQLNKQF
jgi:hypothetical protein